MFFFYAVLNSRLNRKAKLLFLAQQLFSNILKELVDMHALHDITKVDELVLLGSSSVSLQKEVLNILNDQKNISYYIFGKGDYASSAKLLFVAETIYYYYQEDKNDPIDYCLSIYHKLKNPLWVNSLSFEPFHIVLLGDFNKCDLSQLETKLSSLPIGSSVLISGNNSTSNNALYHEVLLNNLNNNNKNSYVKYLQLIIVNPHSNMLIIKTHSGLEIFTTTNIEASQLSEEKIISWKLKQIKNFISFLNNNIEANCREKYEFDSYINTYLGDESAIYNWILGFRSLYTKLLLFNFLICDNFEEFQALSATSFLFHSYENPISSCSFAGTACERDKGFIITQTENLINHDISLNSRIIYGISLLHLAVSLNNINITKFLVNNLVKVNIVDNNNMTPLIISIVKDYNEISSFLRSYSAVCVDVTYITKKISQGQFDIAEKLLSYTCQNASENNKLCGSEYDKFISFICYYIGKHNITLNIDDCYNENPIIEQFCAESATILDIILFIKDRSDILGITTAISED